MVTKDDTAHGLPDEITNCRVQNIGLNGFAECLDVGPKTCPYAVPFGYAFLCQHPRLGAILENTQKEKMVQRQGA